MHKSGFITIIGKPNVGKSTLLNRIVGEKVAITSHKPQTTRQTIRGIYDADDAQIVFIDTPGIHDPKHTLGRIMTDAALSTLGAVDLVLWMVSGLEKIDAVDEKIIERLKALSTPVVLLVNKIDAAKDIGRLETLIHDYKHRFDFKAVFAVSAKTGTHTDLLMEDIKGMLEEGPKYYPEGQVTDHPQSFLIAERIREKILWLTQEEVPHSVMVTIESMEHDEENPNLYNIHASIVVERDSQKGIIIGKGGKMIKRIGTEARKDILSLLGVKIYLDLHCKVVKNWRNKEQYLRHHGFHDER